MNKKSNTTKELTPIGLRLPYGIVKKVAKESGYTEQTVSCVKRGLRYNPGILKALLDAIEKHNAEKDELLKRIQKL